MRCWLLRRLSARILRHCGPLALIALSGTTIGLSGVGQPGGVAAKDNVGTANGQGTMSTTLLPRRTGAPLTTPSIAATTAIPAPSRLLEVDFASKTLGRTVKYYVYLPAGYDSTPTMRYPVLYYLHGIGGDPREWLGYGVREAADELLGSGAIRPFIIVPPQGDQGYWGDQVDGGPQWSTYVATDVVAEIDSTYRTLADRQDRAIGGLSMGARGALQIAMNHADIFSIVGAHSPSFRPRQDIPAHFGDDAQLALRDPISLIAAHSDIARTLTLWLDYGDRDPYRDSQAKLEQELTSEGIPHQYRPWQGHHDGFYWTGHINDYLRYYSASFPAR